MKKLTIRNLLVYTLLWLCACGDQSSLLSEYDTPGRHGFSSVLKAEYTNLADFALKIEGEDEVGEYFLKKARKAYNIQKPLPISPDIVNVPSFAKPSLSRAYALLMDALESKNIPENEELLAMAQTRYDCWAIYRQAYRGENDYFACEEDFYLAISYLKMPHKTVSGEQFNVYFASNSTALDAQSYEVVRQAAAKYHDSDGHTILLNGLTDSKGNIEENKTLAQRRALAVRNALLQNGVHLEDITLNAAGESEARKVEAQNMSDEELRRVEILFEKSRKRTGFMTEISDAPGWAHSSDM